MDTIQRSLDNHIRNLGNVQPGEEMYIFPCCEGEFSPVITNNILNELRKEKYDYLTYHCPYCNEIIAYDQDNDCFNKY